MFTRTLTKVGFHLCIYELFPSFFVDAETPVEVAVNGVVDKVDTDELEFCEEVTEVVNPIVRDPARKNSKEVYGLKQNNHKLHKLSQDQGLAEQYKALLLKQQNLKLEKRKLELEVALLENKVKGEYALTTINLSPVMANQPFLS